MPGQRHPRWSLRQDRRDRRGPRPGPPAVGQEAPRFELPDQHGRRVVLDEVLAQRWALLVFYPFAFSGICTGELRAVRSRLAARRPEALQVLGISCDPVYAQRAFAEAEGLTFPLLSDFWPHGHVAAAYGVLLQERGMPVRGTFLVDRDRRVRWSLVNPPGQARDIAAVDAAVAELV